MMRRAIGVLVAVLMLTGPVWAQEQISTTKIYLNAMTLTSGSGAPTSAEAVGSFYFRTDTGQWYQRTATGWVTYFDGSGNLSVANVTASGSLSVTGATTLGSTLAVNGLTDFNAEIASHVVPSLSDTYDLGSSSKLWRHGYLAQLNAVLFAKETQSLYGGWLSVSKNAGTFAAAVGAADTTIDFGQAMTNGQFVVVRAFDTGGLAKSEFLQVGTNVSGTVYNVTRDLALAHGTDPAWPQGTAYQVRGASGDGWIELNAYDTPRFSLFTQGTLYNNSVENIRLGHLTGMPNSSSGLGLYAGSSTRYLRWDGSDLKLISDSTTIDSTGITIGAGGSTFTATGAYKFVQPTGCGGTGDVYAVHSTVPSPGSTYHLNVENKAVSPSNFTPLNGIVKLSAVGWTSGAPGVAAAEQSITLTSSGSGTSSVNITGSSVGISGNTAVTGTLSASTSISERSRSTPMGEWVSVAYAAGNFTASAGTWTVDSADQVGYSYTLVGKTMTLTVEIKDTDISTTPTVLQVAIPGGFVSAKNAIGASFNSDAAAGFVLGVAQVAAGGTVVQIAKSNLAAFTATSSDNTFVRATITFEIQ